MFKSEKVLLFLVCKKTILGQLFILLSKNLLFTFLQGVLLSWGNKVKKTKTSCITNLAAFLTTNPCGVLAYGSDVIGNSTPIKFCS